MPLRAESRLRPPWFDRIIASTPALAASTASRPVWTPLMTIFIEVFFLNHAISLQFSAGSRFAYLGARRGGGEHNIELGGAWWVGATVFAPRLRVVKR